MPSARTYSVRIADIADKVLQVPSTQADPINESKEYINRASKLLTDTQTNNEQLKNTILEKLESARKQLTKLSVAA